MEELNVKNGAIIDLLLKETITEEELHIQADRVQQERIKVIERYENLRYDSKSRLKS